jgi:hypothetical protein
MQSFYSNRILVLMRREERWARGRLRRSTISAMDPRLEKLREAITAATRDMSAEQLRARPFQKGKWCAAEVLEHLYLTYTGTVIGFERCLAAGKPLAGTPTWKQRCSAALVVGVGRMPSGRASPKNVLPKGKPADTLLADIGSAMVRMDEVIGQCEGRYGTRIKLLDHPILGPLTGKEWRKFHLVHGRHHMKQIVRLRRGF